VEEMGCAFDLDQRLGLCPKQVFAPYPLQRADLVCGSLDHDLGYVQSSKHLEVRGPYRGGHHDQPFDRGLGGSESGRHPGPEGESCYPFASPRVAPTHEAKRCARVLELSVAVTVDPGALSHP